MERSLRPKLPARMAQQAELAAIVSLLYDLAKRPFVSHASGNAVSVQPLK